MSATITEQIARDLRERLQQRRPLPAARLTLTHLASHYRVSQTPIRLAIETLLREGYLVRQSNGRLGIAEILPETTPPELPEETPAAIRVLTAGREQDLIGEIVARSLRGENGYLREEAMARRFGIGRTVLRQTFSRLAGKGLLEHVPRCGWRVRVFDGADMRAYLVAREALELAALDLALPHLDPADLTAMLHGNEPDADGGESTQPLDNALHGYLIEKAGNAYIRDFFDRNGLYYTFLFDFAAPGAYVLADMAAQHRAILSALLEGDRDAAREALSRHIRAQEPIVARLMEHIMARSSSSPTSAEGLARFPEQRVQENDDQDHGQGEHTPHHQIKQ